MVRILRPIPVEHLKLLVFDLDGTLIDSAQDLCNSVNATLVHFAREPLPDETIAGFIGNGAMMLVRRAFGPGAAQPATPRMRTCWPERTPGSSTTIANTSWITPTPMKEFWRRWPPCGSCTTRPPDRAATPCGRWLC